MPYDDVTAERVRVALAPRPGITERKMFGGLAFLLRGHMVCGVLGRDLVLRLGDDGAARALARKHARPMDFTGRPLRSMVYVAPAGFKTEGRLRRWLEAALDHVETLPPK